MTFRALPHIVNLVRGIFLREWRIFLEATSSIIFTAFCEMFPVTIGMFFDNASFLQGNFFLSFA